MSNQICFNTQPPEGGWFLSTEFSVTVMQFQHTAARRRLVGIFLKLLTVVVFQHTAARRRLGPLHNTPRFATTVSTHSRPKAAGRLSLCVREYVVFQHTAARRRLETPACSTLLTTGFNTQPPEGGWFESTATIAITGRFNTQPPEGGWHLDFVSINIFMPVSTHSRPKAAGRTLCRPIP